MNSTKVGKHFFLTNVHCFNFFSFLEKPDESRNENEDREENISNARKRETLTQKEKFLTFKTLSYLVHNIYR